MLNLLFHCFCGIVVGDERFEEVAVAHVDAPILANRSEHLEYLLRWRTSPDLVLVFTADPFLQRGDLEAA